VAGAYNAGSIEASLKLDRSDFNRELNQAKKDAEEFQKTKYSPKIDLDDTEAKAKLRALKDELASLRNISVTAALSGYDSLATQLTALQGQADRLNATSINIRAQIDDTAARATLALLDAEITAMNMRTITIHADVDTAAAAASLAALRAAAAAPITIRTNTTGGGPRPRVSPSNNDPDPDPDAPHVPDLGDGDPDDDDDGDRRRIRKVKDPLNLHLGALVSLPGLIASVLPQLPALTTLLGGATAAVASFGVAAGGALGIYGMATVGAVKQATAHAKAVDLTQIALEKAQERLAGTTAGTEAYKKALKDVTEAEKAHKKAIDDLTPAEKKFNASIEQTKGAWQSFIGATSKYTLAPVTTVIQGAAAALPKFIPLVKDLAPVVQDVADSLKNWMSGDGLTRFVTFLQTYGVPILKNTIGGFKGFLTAGGAIIRAFGPWALKMSEYIGHVGKAADKWGKNGGAERFKESVKRAWAQVRPILSGLVRLTQHVWDILSGTGQTNGDALAKVIGGIADAVGQVQPAAIKAFGEIFQSIADVAVALAPVIGITSKAIVDIVNALPPGTIRLIADAMIAWKLAIIGWNAAVVVWDVLVGVIGAMETAWIALTIAWGLSPLGVIIAGIVALVAVIVIIATKTTWFQQLWHMVWGGIKTAFNATVEFLRGKFGLLALLLGPIGAIAWIAANWTKVWGTIKGVWSAIVAGAAWLWGYIKPVFVAIGDAFVTVAKVWWKVHETIFKVIFILFEAAIKALWVFGIKPVLGWISDGWHALGTGFKWVVGHILKPAWDAFASAGKAVWDHTLGPVFGWIGDGWRAMANGFKWVNNHILKPAWDAVSGAARNLWQGSIKPVFQSIQDWIGDKWRAIKNNVFSPMGTFFTKTIPGWGTTMKKGLVEAFDSAWKGIQKVWDNVKKAIGTPIYWVAKYVWNDAIWKIMDKISSFVHQDNPLGKINTDKIPHFAAGGPVPHTAGSRPGKDSVNAVLMPDEHVFTREDVAAMGGHHAVQAFRSSLHGGRPVMGANTTGRFGVGGWISDVGDGLKNAANKGLDALEDAALGALAAIVNPVINKAEGAIDKIVPGSGAWSNLAGGVMKKPLEDIKGWVNREDKKALAVGGKIPEGRHLAIINAAMRYANVPPPGTKGAWQAGLNTLITRESGWNSNAINLTDSNAKAGHPSQGLAQTIPGTFHAYVPAALADRSITDPVANVAAAIRYIVARYGNINNVQQANANKAPKGYWTGTNGAASGLAWVGERGPELVNFHGGETVYNHKDSLHMASMGSLHGYASGTGTRHQRHVVREAFEERDRDRARRDAAQKKYDAAHTKYLHATTAKEQAAAKKEMAKYDKQIDKANKEIASDTKLIKLNEKRYKNASKAVEQERKDAATLAAAKKKARDAEISKERKAAQDYIAGKKAAIDAKIAVATDARNSYKDAAMQTGALSGLSGNRAAGFTQQLQAKIKAIKDFQVNLHTLAKLGMSQALIQQIAAMGPEQGGQLAQSLARSSSSADLKKLNDTYKELETVSGKYADSAADDGFGLSTLKKQSKALAGAKITVTAPHTIMVNIDGKKFRAHTEKVVEEKVSEIVAVAGKKK
jgi:SLT domain-containing protein